MANWGNNTACAVCKIETIDDPSHNSSAEHKFNTLCWEFHHYRKRLVKDRDGIQLKIEPATNIPRDKFHYSIEANKGKHIFKVSPDVLVEHNSTVMFKCTLTNISRNNIGILHAQVLHPFQLYSIYDRDGNLENNLFPELEPKSGYVYLVQCTIPEVTQSVLKIPVSFIFAKKTDKPQHHTLVRTIVIEVRDTDYVSDSPKDSPFTGTNWKGITIMPCNLPVLNDRYGIPKNMFKILLYGFREYNSMSGKDNQELNRIRSIIRQGHPTIQNYKEYFHILLWLEEITQIFALQHYNMENVHLRLFKNNMLELTVPGLAEKRPSIIPKDKIHIRIHNDGLAYEGIIKHVQDSNVIISDVNSELIEILQHSPDVEMDVSFQLGRIPLERMHRGVDEVVKKGLVNVLFPTGRLLRPEIKPVYSLTISEMVNQKVFHNREQHRAVCNILNCTSQCVPYIIFGPPGTGKTETIVEAILQIKRKTNKRILICAPANAACDMLAKKLVRYCKKKEMLRVNSSSREEVPIDLQPFSNDLGYNPTAEELLSYRIVISTLVYIGRYSGSQYNPEYIFIDEAAQAMEPEADIAIGLSQKPQIVLTGDPKQLGPICSSKLAMSLKLDVSLLERLMNTELYTTNNPKFITMLILNYRSHERILHIPNRRFYGNKLMAVSAAAQNDPIAYVNIYPLLKNKPKKKNGSAIEFCSIISKECREGRSPSYFNFDEALTVVRYILCLLNKVNSRPEFSGDCKIVPEQIGVVTPYIRQVYKIKELLSQHNYKDQIEVGTTEAFQGREKRILLITTVRAQENLLLYDRKYQLGFVKHANRFNVALTRAKSKLIVVGCPLVLQTDDKWLEYMEACQEFGAYYGPPIAKRDDATRDEITRRIKRIQNH